MWIDEGNIYLCNVENGYAGEVFICYMLNVMENTTVVYKAQNVLLYYSW
jgi:hypothetical protein